MGCFCKNKKGITFVNAFMLSTLDGSKRKPSRIRLDQGSEFYKSFFKIWLKENHIEVYLTCNEGKSVFAKTLKNKMYKHMTVVPKFFILIVQMILFINKITYFIELLKWNSRNVA